MLTQPRSVSGSLGQKAIISCARSSGSISSYYVHWYQQRPGSAPITVIYEYNKRPSGVPDRFSGSTDSSSNSAYLTISGLQPEDEADYYCQSYDGGSNKHSTSGPWGSETKTLQRVAHPHQGGCSFLSSA